MRKTGWPARSRSRTSRRVRPLAPADTTRTRDRRVLVGPAERLSDNRKHAAALLAGAFGHELFDPRAERLELVRKKQCQFVPPFGRMLRHEGAEARPGLCRRLR